MTTLYFIRHGEIDANVERRWHGSTDSPLNDTGKLQAARMADHVSQAHPEIAAVYCSPLIRTHHTAKQLADRLGLNTVTMPGLTEYSLGSLEDTPFDVLAREHKFFEAIAANENYAPQGGESLNNVCTRMLDTINEIRGRHQDQSVAVVSHGAAIGIALSSILKARVYPFQEYTMANTAYSKLIWSGQPTLEFFNTREHLDLG